MLPSTRIVSMWPSFGAPSQCVIQLKGHDKSKIPTIDYLEVKPAPAPSLPDALSEVKLTPPVPLPATEHWL